MAEKWLIDNNDRPDEFTRLSGFEKQYLQENDFSDSGSDADEFETVPDTKNISAGQALKSDIQAWFGIESITSHDETTFGETWQDVLDSILNQFTKCKVGLSISNHQELESILQSEVPNDVSERCEHLNKILFEIIESGSDNGGNRILMFRKMIQKCILVKEKIFSAEQEKDCKMIKNYEVIDSLQLVLEATVFPDAWDIAENKEALHRLWTEVWKSIISTVLGKKSTAIEGSNILEEFFILYNGASFYKIKRLTQENNVSKLNVIHGKPDMMVMSRENRDGEMTTKRPVFTIEVKAVAPTRTDSEQDLSSTSSFSLEDSSSSSSSSTSSIKSGSERNLNTRHVLELFAAMRTGQCDGKPLILERVFGLFMSNSNVYMTCMYIGKLTHGHKCRQRIASSQRNQDDYEVVIDAVHSYPDSLPALKWDKCLHIKHFTSTCLDLFRTHHVKALLSFLQFVIWHEHKKAVYKKK